MQNLWRNAGAYIALVIVFLIFALLAAVACHFQILREEEFLRRQYGDEFDDYAKRTARYLIW